MDRAEATGLGVAAAGHVALLAALTYGLAATRLPVTKSDPIEVAFVDETQLESASPDPSQEASGPAAAFEPLPEVAPPVPSPIPPPPTPAPQAPPAPAARTPAPVSAPAPRPATRPQPPKPAAATNPPAPRPARPGPAPARSRQPLNINLDGARDGPGKAETAGAPAAVMNAKAMASIGSQIRRQVQPCADRMVNPGPGASRIKVRLNLKLNRNGSLRAPPSVEGVSGLDEDNRRYAQRVKEMAVAVFTSCSPLRDLPAELYAVSNGWSDFDMIYNLP
ncbi:MAG TPA: cell envelope biogenesis protein TolA [Allosphingosinicella sp.]|jgi:hypothetical protein|nr:cell envelope biogenesis protein TolA [Allosphingosinicella sp.]